jgi:polysaccharide pyruvyl transferase WcaK-like protein
MIKPIAYFRVDTSNRGDWAIQKSITEAIKKRIDVPFALFSLKNDELTEERILKQINTDCSALMIAGSGIYSNYNMSSGFYFRCKPELFNKITVPIFLIGLGNNQNLKGNVLSGELKPETKTNIKLINDLAKLSTVRDQNTFDLLKNLGITKHELQLDPGNFLDVKQQPKRKKVAIQIAQHAPILGRFDGTMELRTYNIATYAKISKYLISEGYEVVFIAHDALEHSLIVDLQKIEPRIEGLNTDNLDVMLQEYARCSFAISMKMHSAIMAFASGTPAIQVYYDKKSIEYMKMINCEELGINVFDKYSANLKNKVDYMLKNYNIYANYIQTLKQKEQIKFNRLINNICEIIKNEN